MVVNAFLSGAIALGFGVTALCFQRHWRVTRIRLFNLFAVAFLIMALERVAGAVRVGIENAPQLYLLRLTAFLVIIAAIINHNRRQ